MADDNKMAEQSEQERYRQENEMAGGPVSRGASNKDAPMNQKNRRSSSTPRDKGKPQSADYNKLIGQNTSGTSKGSGTQTGHDPGTVGGGTIPNPGRGTGESRGGMGISNSTVASGGTSAGAVIGEGSTRDRGSMPNREADASTNNATELTHEGQGKVPTRIANSQPGPRPARKSKRSK